MFGNGSIEQVFSIKMKIKYGTSQQKNKKQNIGWQKKGDDWHGRIGIKTTEAIREISGRNHRQKKNYCH